MPKIVQAAKAKQSVIELGNLDVARDFSDVRDVARFYSELIHSPNEKELRRLNICSGKAHTLKQILDYAQKAANHQFDEIKVNPSFVRANEIKLLVGDPSILNKAVIDIKRYSLESTIEWMTSGNN